MSAVPRVRDSNEVSTWLDLDRKLPIFDPWSGGKPEERLSVCDGAVPSRGRNEPGGASDCTPAEDIAVLIGIVAVRYYLQSDSEPC